MVKMTEKQKLFCDEYLIDLNAIQAATRAGYSKQTARNASRWLDENSEQYKPYMKEYIGLRLQEKQDALIAKQDEVLRYLTSVMRGESSSEVVVVEGTGDGCSEARLIQKKPDEKERLKAGELLGKRYGLYTDKMNVDVAIPVIISGEDELEE